MIRYDFANSVFPLFARNIRIFLFPHEKLYDFEWNIDASQMLFPPKSFVPTDRDHCSPRSQHCDTGNLENDSVEKRTSKGYHGYLWETINESIAPLSRRKERKLITFRTEGVFVEKSRFLNFDEHKEIRFVVNFNGR